MLLSRYRKWKVKEEEKARLKAEKIKRREAKIARGEALGPEDELEKDPNPWFGLLKFIIFLVGFVLALGWFITGSPLWEYEGKWAHLQSYFPVR
jgi:hypothetical protein